jgi:zinc protease
VTLDDVNRVAHQYLLNVNTISATLRPGIAGASVPFDIFGSADKVEPSILKPIKLPMWAEERLERLGVPVDHTQLSDVFLANGIRLIVKTDSTSPTVTVVGSIKHSADLQTPIGQEGIADVLDSIYSYGSRKMGRLAFQKALDDISADESAGYHFSLNVLKDDFARGMQLLADNELDPPLDAGTFANGKSQAIQGITGDLRSSEYRSARALNVAMVPRDDPALRNATLASLSSLTLTDAKAYRSATVRPDLTTIVVVGDISPEDARTVVDKSFGNWSALGPKPETTLPSVPLNRASLVTVVDPTLDQDEVVLTEQLKLDRFASDYYSLQLGTQVLDGGFYAARLYHDLRQDTGYVYMVDVSLDVFPSRASYTVTCGCGPENVSKVRAIIERDLNQMRTENVSVQELHQAKALLLRQVLLEESSEDEIAAGILERAEDDLPLDEPYQAAKKFMELNAEDVKAAFARLVRPEDLIQVVRGPAPRFQHSNTNTLAKLDRFQNSITRTIH